MQSVGTLSEIFADQSKINPVFFSLILVGLFIKLALSELVLSNDGSTGPASSLIWGYSLVIFSLIGIVVVNVDPGSNEWNDIKHLPWVMLMTIVLMVWVIGINIQYYTQINLKTVPDEFFTWSNYSTILLLCLIGISVYQYALTSSGKTDTAASLYIYSVLILIFNLIAVSIQQVILNCFYVDG
jgi:hypothetical protein